MLFVSSWCFQQLEYFPQTQSNNQHCWHTAKAQLRNFISAPERIYILYILKIGLLIIDWPAGWLASKASICWFWFMFQINKFWITAKCIQPMSYFPINLKNYTCIQHKPTWNMHTNTLLTKPLIRHSASNVQVQHYRHPRKMFHKNTACAPDK